MQEIVKFVAARAASTVISYAAYILLLRWMNYELSYFIAYVLGVAFSYAINAKVVFRQPISRRSAVLFPLVYVLQFLLGVLILRVAVEMFGAPEWLAMVFSIVLTLPLVFILSRWAMQSNTHTPKSP